MLHISPSYVAPLPCTLHIESDSMCNAGNIVLQVGKPFDLVVLAALLSGLIKTSNPEVEPELVCPNHLSLS